MSDNKVQVGGSGIGLVGLLFITFLVLKLTGVITWSWWWVTAPLWGPLAIILVIVAVVLLIAACIGIAKSFF